MKKFIASLLVFTTMGLYGNLYAKESRGADLVIQKIDGQQIKGELIAVKQDSLLLKESESGADVSVSLRDTKFITINNKSHALEWGGVGFLLGGASGALIGNAMGDTEQSGSGFRGTFFWETAEFKALLIGFIGGVLGAIIGGLVISGQGERIIQVEGKSDTEIKKILEELRKKARVPDFQ